MEIHSLLYCNMLYAVMTVVKHSRQGMENLVQEEFCEIMENKRFVICFATQLRR